MRRAALSAVALTLAMALATPAPATPPKAELVDIEDEVMCTICGTLLELAHSPQAERERVYVSKLIRQGKSKSEIKDALVEQYGSEVLATPEPSGFNLSAYLVPAIAFLVAALALAIGLLRWRRGAPPPGSKPPSPPPSGAEAERLEADLSRYDL